MPSNGNNYNASMRQTLKEGEVRKLLHEAIVLGLSGAEFCSRFRYSTLAEDYNGVGPEWMDERVRRVLTSINEDILMIFFIHDVRWSHSDGTREFFHFTNKEMRENGHRLARLYHKWYSPWRYVLMHRVSMISGVCEEFGWNTYREAYLRSKEMTK